MLNRMEIPSRGLDDAPMNPRVLRRAADATDDTTLWIGLRPELFEGWSETAMEPFLEAPLEGKNEMSTQSSLDSVDALRKELDEALLRVSTLESKLACQARERTELVHLVSHELRTPITVISGFGRLLQNEAHGTLNKEQTHYIDQSLKACRRLDQFVVDLLDAQHESGTPLSVEMEEADLHVLIRSRLESLAPLLEERGIQVDLDLAARGSRLLFDERRIEQVITNLMMNAIRYGRHRGVIRISTKSARDGEAGTIKVAIEDDGPGVPVADREHLFAPYVRGEGQDDCEGLGIGLAICRRVIASHGGTIHVDSSELGGARFEFTLPGRVPANREV
jgi:signal transduction histidine kinase